VDKHTAQCHARWGEARRPRSSISQLRTAVIIGSQYGFSCPDLGTVTRASAAS
jgi:hypothetical protein